MVGISTNKMVLAALAMPATAINTLRGGSGPVNIRSTSVPDYSMESSTDEIERVPLKLSNRASRVFNRAALRVDEDQVKQLIASLPRDKAFRTRINYLAEQYKLLVFGDDEIVQDKTIQDIKDELHEKLRVILTAQDTYRIGRRVQYSKRDKQFFFHDLTPTAQAVIRHELYDGDEICEAMGLVRGQNVPSIDLAAALNRKHFISNVEIRDNFHAEDNVLIVKKTINIGDKTSPQMLFQGRYTVHASTNLKRFGASQFADMKELKSELSDGLPARVRRQSTVYDEYEAMTLASVDSVASVDEVVTIFLEQEEVTKLMAKFESRENAYDELAEAIYRQDTEDRNDDLVGTVFHYPDNDRYEFVAFGSEEYHNKLRRAYPKSQFAKSKKARSRKISDPALF